MSGFEITSVFGCVWRAYGLHCCGFRQLILRNGGYTAFDAACCPRLANLEVLSLSNNALTSVEGFHHFHRLVEVRAVVAFDWLLYPRWCVRDPV